MRIAFGLSLALWCAAAGSACANPVVPGMPRPQIPAPAPPPPELRIVPVSGADRQTRLQLPAKLLRGEVGLPPTRPAASLNHLVAALALSLALVLGGLWLARRLAARRVVGLAGAALAVLVVVSVSGCPPLRPFPAGTYNEELAPLTSRPDGSLEGEALLEKTAAGDNIRLLIDREQLGKFLEKEATPAAQR